MGGADKPLLDWRGRPLIAWVIDRLAPQVDRLWISANRNLERYAATAPAARLVEDSAFARMGPLAGILAVAESIAASATNDDQELLVVPGDAPLVPRDLAERLLCDSARASFAVTEQGPQPLHLRLPLADALTLEDTLKSGQRSAQAWLTGVGAEAVRFENEAAFANFNRPEDLADKS